LEREFLEQEFMTFKIGTLARRTGTSAPTIRYYEDIGLLPHPDRRDLYEADDNMRFVLNEIRQGTLRFEDGVRRIRAC
jgi:DNA-binding transcriptional MerR regulator